MWIFRFNRFLQNSLRLIAIIFIIIKHGINNWLYNSRIPRRIFDPKGRKLTTRSERIRLMIEDLGPTFIKFGQIIADRPDLASEQLREELKKLQSSAKPFDSAIAFRLIEEELGDPINDIFLQLSPEPIASASIAQVYKGILKTGQEVAIKIQRPNIRQKIKVDLVLMHILAKQAVKSYPELANFNVIGFVEDFGTLIKKELDFTNEAANMLRFSAMFKDDEHCYIPKVFNKHTTQKLIVMEFVSGIRPDDIEALKEAGLDTQAIAENGTNIILKMILRYGFFHADPHPGNIFIRENNQVVLLDHGMTASLKPKQIQALINFIMGFSRQNPHKITKALLSLLEVTYFKDEENLEFEISEMIQKYSYVPYENMDISSLLSETFNIIVRYDGLKIPSNLFMLLKAIATIQKFAEKLNAEVSLPELIKPYATEKIMDRFNLDNIINKIMSSAEDYLYIVDQLPKDIKEIINNLRKGVLKHEINIREDSFTNKAMRQGINRFAFVMIMGLMLVCSTLLMIFIPEKQAIRIFFYVTVTIVSWTALRLLTKTTIS